MVSIRNIPPAVALAVSLLVPAAVPPAVDGPATSLHSRITVRSATPTQLQRLQNAVDRFESAGLLLPDLEVVFADNPAECGGHLGRFEDRFTPWRVSICTDTVDTVYEHELAHAWERFNLDDEARLRFLAHTGLGTWADEGTDWGMRGVERAAVVIQKGISGISLPVTLSPVHRERLSAYRLLTGRTAPLFDEWLARTQRQQRHDGGGLGRAAVRLTGGPSCRAPALSMRTQQGSAEPSLPISTPRASSSLTGLPIPWRSRPWVKQQGRGCWCSNSRPTGHPWRVLLGYRGGHGPCPPSGSG